MTALVKESVKAPVRPTGKKPSPQEMFERTMKRFQDDGAPCRMSRSGSTLLIIEFNKMVVAAREPPKPQVLLNLDALEREIASLRSQALGRTDLVGGNGRL